MAHWAPKRFWSEAAAVAEGGGWAVHLDGRPVRTPAKAHLVVPTRGLAARIAAEWQAQKETVDPRTMPFTGSANTAIDKVAVQFDEVAEMIAAYGDCDLLCYRAEMPAELVARQAAGWDPLIDWSARVLGAPLRTAAGVMHVPQDGAALAALSGRVRALTHFELTAFHDLVALSGSLVIGCAVVEGWDAPEDLWALSRIDEDWQEARWGRDDEAAVQAELRRNAFLHATEFFSLVRKTR